MAVLIALFNRLSCVCLITVLSLRSRLFATTARRRSAHSLVFALEVMALS
jgi:hypothetical protein